MGPNDQVHQMETPIAFLFAVLLFPVFRAKIRGARHAGSQIRIHEFEHLHLHLLNLFHLRPFSVALVDSNALDNRLPRSNL